MLHQDATGGGSMKNIIKWINKNRLMSRWDLDDLEFSQIIRSGVLPIYLDLGTLPSDSELEQLRQIKYGEDIRYDSKAQLEDSRAESKEGREALYSEKETERINYHYSPLSFESFESGWFSDSYLRFKMEDIDRVENEYPHLLKSVDDITDDLQTSQLSEIIEQHEADLRDYENVFFRTGKNWFIKFDNKATTLPDLERIRYVAHLLGRPNQEVNVVNLYNIVKERSPNQLRAEYVGKHLAGLDETQKKLVDPAEIRFTEYNKHGKDEKAKGDGRELSETILLSNELSYEDQEGLKIIGYNFLAELEVAQHEGNTGEIEEAKTKMEYYKGFMFNEYGIKVSLTQEGRLFFNRQLKRPEESIERVRKNVSIQIKKALEDIKRSIPSLESYLSNHISTGIKCTYTPDQGRPVNWFIST